MTHQILPTDYYKNTPQLGQEHGVAAYSLGFFVKRNGSLYILIPHYLLCHSSYKKYKKYPL
jgi:hypothetical protein